MWFISGSPKENLVKQWVLTDLLWLTLRWVVYMKRLMHKTSLRSSLTLPALTLHLCKPFVWFSQAHRVLCCMTGNMYFPFFFSGHSIPHRRKRTQDWGHIHDISKCEIMQNPKGQIWIWGRGGYKKVLSTWNRLDLKGREIPCIIHPQDSSKCTWVVCFIMHSPEW